MQCGFVYFCHLTMLIQSLSRFGHAYGYLDESYDLDRERALITFTVPREWLCARTAFYCCEEITSVTLRYP